MKYQPLPISKTYSRFVALAGKIQRLLKSGEFQKLSARQKKQLADRLQQLYRRLSVIFSPGRLQRILASATFILGLGTGVARAQQFAPRISAPFGLSFNESIPFMAFGDLDDDDDQDLLAIEYSGMANGRVFVFYENVGTSEAPAFGMPQTNPFGLLGPRHLSIPSLVDIDNDSDLDFFTGTYAFDGSVGKVLYFENQGTAQTPSFASAIENPFGLQSPLYYTAPVFVDLDNDGDFDFLGTNYDVDFERDEFQYQENTGSSGAPQFGAAVNDPFGLSNMGLYAIFHATGDLDMDGDFDVLAGGGPLNYMEPAFVNYLENVGSPESPAFASAVSNPFGIAFPDNAYVTAPVFVDIDNDGDLDLFVSAYTYDVASGEVGFEIWYFENTDMVNKSEERTVPITLNVFPTVTDSWLNWQIGSTQLLPKLHLEAFAIDGRRMGSWQIDGQYQGRINIGHLPGGLYQLCLADGSGRLLARERFVVR